MRKISLVVSVLLMLSVVLSACAPAATPAPTTAPVAPAATTAPAMPAATTAPAMPAATTAPAAPAPTTAPAPTQAATSSVPTNLPRNQTLFVSGAAWGPASTWNPFQTGNLANTSGTVGLVYETLFSFDPLSGKLSPFLAASGTWTNPTTYDVVLRPGLTWSDGQPLTADDVVFTFTLGKTNTALWFSSLWTSQGLANITSADATHVEFTFTSPIYQEWDFNLYNIPIVPKHIWSTMSADEIATGTNANPVGSGAYLYLATGQDRNVWQRNDNWWGIKVFGTPAPKYIVDIRTSSNNVALGMVLQGQLDLSNNFLPGVASLVDNGYAGTYFPKAPYMLAANTAYLAMNLTMKPLDDPAFRKALAYAIDVPTIVQKAYANLVTASTPGGLLPGLSQYDDAAVQKSLGYHFDTATAKKMLAAAGYKTGSDGFVTNKDGSPIKLQVTCPNGWTDWMAAIAVIASSAQAAGINVTAATPAQSDWNTALQSGTFQMTLQNNTPLTNTPWTTYNYLFTHPIQSQMQIGNYGRYNNQAMFDAVDALGKVQTSDAAGMKAAVSKIQTIMLTDMPVIPLWYNGAWAQWTNGPTAVWTGFPTSTSTSPTYPMTWNGYWQTGGLNTLINLKPVTPK
ncbi:MAG TPA: ABC transporter substrate-binding protein [Anaerolineaceae bacterium]|nr:ABC transporter substrate-binding protein [Anaerolineaceae bacterium]